MQQVEVEVVRYCRSSNKRGTRAAAAAAATTL